MYEIRLTMFEIGSKGRLPTGNIIYHGITDSGWGILWIPIDMHQSAHGLAYGIIAGQVMVGTVLTKPRYRGINDIWLHLLNIAIAQAPPLHSTRFIVFDNQVYFLGKGTKYLLPLGLS